MMNVDCAYHIGKTHFVCQDYAISGLQFEQPYVIVADGCSGSKDTDVGARLLAQAAKSFVLCPVLSDMYQPTIITAGTWRLMMGLEENALDATLMTLSVKNGMLRAGIYGDGVLAVMYKKLPKLVIHQISYPSGYPNYLNYIANIERRSRVSKLIQGSCNSFSLGNSGQFAAIGNSVLGDKPFYYEAPIEDITYAAVMTDGTGSFVKAIETETSKTQEPVTIVQVLEEMLAFKSFQGAFVQRRLQRFAKDCSEKQWSHSDDLSMGVIST